ncbi:hypothetical protein GP486_002981 [Trichoglossum hirsutum]|uniref:Uncharacterized protein n=1 Tax=Trichoglossum hirsutum TaxID=265104 RepID=A0A9P8LE05_9PEZI|nr:hypothetical protein GP486_002981 [Trichoglossum hirsutum]
MERLLVRKNIAKEIKAANGELPDGDLPPGHMVPQLSYAQNLPSDRTYILEAGLYGIETKQKVTAAGNDPLQIWNYKGQKDETHTRAVERQLFSVVAPQFNIDPKLINTFYPPSGHQDEGRILPHIVFNDAHVPWFRRAGIFYPFLDGPIDKDTVRSRPGRNMVPWMAVVVFDPEELLVSPGDAKATGLDQIASYKEIGLSGNVKPPPNGAYPMTVGDYLSKIPKNRIFYEAGYRGKGEAELRGLKESKDMTSVIFPRKSLVKQIFGGKDNPKVLEGQKLMAHVRHINTEGFPDAGVEEEGYYSVVVSSRTGQVTNRTPTSQAVHLVSFEHYDSTLNDPESPFDTLDDQERIGLISLYSWVYTCIPEAVNFVDTMENLATNMQPLRPPKTVLDTLLKTSSEESHSAALQSAAARVLHDRLSNSYTICRWRTATGEETVAFNRGPLVATPTSDVPSKPPQDWFPISMTGKDYQIFDEDVGLMDMTYSSAWSLGKLVAISDSAFNAALLRFRSLVWQKSSSKTRMLVNNMYTASEVLARVPSAIGGASAIQPDTFAGPVLRLNPSSTDPVAPPLTHPEVAPLFAKALRQAVDTVTSATDGETLYSDFDLESAANSDWELIHGWISDCLYLGKIPEPEFDLTRLRIKEIYNFYLSKDIHGLEGRTPPIPRYGFVVRSMAVKAAPDLKITATRRIWEDGKWKEDLDQPDHRRRDPIVRLRRMDDFTILCLLDCLPEEIFQITLAQPPHQQRFAMGASLIIREDGSIHSELEVQMLYTSSKAPKGKGKDGEWPSLPPSEQSLVDQSHFYDVDRRCINPITIAGKVNFALVNSKAFPGMYDDGIPNACVLGLQLNDPCCKPIHPMRSCSSADLLTSVMVDQLVINGPKPSKDGPFDPWKRQLWVGAASDPKPHQPNATLSVSSPPTSSTEPVAAQPMVVAPPPAPATAISLPSLLAAPRLNSSRVIPVSSATVATASTSTGAIDGPQFTLIIHPDYRPPPPMPFQTTSGSIIYAPMDFLPTDTKFLYDIIIAIRRKRPNSNPKLRLAELSVELPISDGIDAPDSRGNIREPFIDKGGYNGPGVRMAGNLRFVPTLYTADDPTHTGKTVLGIKLIPRSGEQDATIVLANDGRTTEASVRLAECPIAKIVDKTKGVQVAQANADGRGTGTSREARGVCKILLKEVYVMSDGSRRTIKTDGEVRTGGDAGIPLWTLKREGGDLDLFGHAV